MKLLTPSSLAIMSRGQLENLTLFLVIACFQPSCTFFHSSSDKTGASSDVRDSENVKKTPQIDEEVSELPKDLKWETNNEEPVWADPRAKKGGTFRGFTTSFPLTLRVVGPDSNTSARSYIDGNMMSLITRHPNTNKVIPMLATHWAYGNDKKTVYYKINPLAKWSDGKPIIADDFLFMIRFMRSKNIIAPYYNDYFTKKIASVLKYDDHTISVSLPLPKPDLIDQTALTPLPKHYYENTVPKDFVRRYNWKIVPNSGAYQLSKIRKGKYLIFKRKKNWWAKDLRYFKHRFNADIVRIDVIRTLENAFTKFRKGRLSFFNIIWPDYWHKFTNREEFKKGYINKLWFYNDIPRSPQGLYLNTQDPILKDLNVRLALAHAVNVDKVSKTLLRNDYERLPQAFFGYGEYTNMSIEARAFDIKLAEKYLIKAGWSKKDGKGIRIKKGKRLSLNITYGSKHIGDRLSIIKEDAKQAGIELNLQLLDSSAAYKLAMEKNHQVIYWAWSTKMRPSYWESYHSENAGKPNTNNLNNFANKEVDELIIRYRDSIEASERIILSKKIQRLIADQAVFIPSWNVPYFREAYWRWWRIPDTPATKTSGSAFDVFSQTDGGLFWYEPTYETATKQAMDDNIPFPESVIVDEKYRVRTNH